MKCRVPKDFPGWNALHVHYTNIHVMLMAKRPCYYGSTFIATKSDVDCHIKNVYAKSPRSELPMFSNLGSSLYIARLEGV